MQMQGDAQSQDLAFREQLYDEWKNTYGPLEKDLVNQASSDQPLNYAPVASKIQANFDTAGRNQEAALARSGNLGGGYQRNSNLEMGRATALSDAYSQGLQQRDALRANLYSASKQMPGQATNVSQGFQNMAGLYGQQANTMMNASASGWQGVGNGLSNLGYQLGQSSIQNQIPSAGLEVNNGAVPYTTQGTESLTQARLRDAGISY
jgi:hypothetical protein